MTAAEFSDYLNQIKIARTVLKIQEHHTYLPSYKQWTGNNHFEIQKGMQNTHKNVNGWMDIGQHISIFPDGMVVTGRSFEFSPAGIYGNNANAFCIENVGDFDKENDQMNPAQKDAIVKVTATLCKKFGLAINTDSIVYHHWFNLATGVRNNGSGNNKSCPGTNFFGGNKVEDCNKFFLPLVSKALKSKLNISETELLKYTFVNTSKLNVRTGPSAESKLANDREPVSYGAVIRVYEEKDNWYRISSSKQHWVSAKYTSIVTRATVTAGELNVRSGDSSNFPIVGKLHLNETVFIFEKSGNWAKISVESKWVSANYLKTE